MVLKRLLDHVQRSIRIGLTFDGADLGPVGFQRQHGAGFHRLAIYMHDTGTALAGIAADVGAGQPCESRKNCASSVRPSTSPDAALPFTVILTCVMMISLISSPLSEVKHATCGLKTAIFGRVATKQREPSQGFDALRGRGRVGISLSKPPTPIDEMSP